MAADQWLQRMPVGQPVPQQVPVIEEAQAAKTAVVYENAGQKPPTTRGSAMARIFGYAIPVWFVIVIGVLFGFWTFNGFAIHEGRSYDGGGGDDGGGGEE